jgi:Ca2+-binding RTX toxin-like protein
VNKVGSNNSDLIWGGSGADNLYGAGGADLIYGAGGRDLLNGQDGNDALFGGDGNDYLVGGLGADLLDGGSGIDAADYTGAGSAVTVDLSRTGVQDTRGAGSDWLISIEEVYGSAFADLITGNGSDNQLLGAGGNDTLSGGAGKDTLIGGDGNDRLDGGSARDYFEGGAGDDTYVADTTNDYAYEAAGGGTDTVLSSATYSLDTNVENLTLTGSANIDGWGNPGVNVMIGNDAANTIYGYEGNDTLRGMGGDDVLGGGDHDDLIDGGAGSDTLTFAGSSIAVSVDLRIAGGQNTGRGVDTLVSIENIVGSGMADTLIANAAVNRLEGAIGADTYRFFALGDLNGDTIVKAAGVGDRIDLSGIDANASLAGDQAFALVGAFSNAAGQARYVVDAGGAAAHLYLDVNGDGASDASLTVTGLELGVMGFVL